MVEQPRTFLEKVLDTRPSMYSGATEDKSPTIIEKAKLEGNQAFRDYLISYNAISELPLTSSEKITKLQTLLEQVEQAKLTREGREAFGESDGANTSPVDFVPLIQMIDGELKTLQEQTIPDKSEVKAESKTQVELDIESLEESLVKIQAEVNEALSTLNPTFLKDVTTIELIFSKLESVGEKIRIAIDKSDSSAVVKTDQEIRINEILKKIKYLRVDFKREWVEKATKIFPELTSFFTAIELLKKHPVKESPTVLLVAARDEFNSVIESIKDLSIPDEYKEILKNEINTLFNEVKDKKLIDWKDWLELPGKNGNQVNELTAKYAPYLEDGSVLEISDVEIGEAQTVVDQAKAVYTDLSKSLEEQKEFWEREYLPKAEDVLKRLKEKKKKTEDRISTLAVRSSELARTIASIEARLHTLNTSESPKINKDKDFIEEAYKPIYDALNEAISKSTNPEDLKDLEIRIRVSEYKHRRRAYIQNINYVESTNTGSDELGKNLDTLVFEGYIFTRMKGLIGKLGELGSDWKDKLQKDIEAVMKDYSRRKLFHFSWMSVRKDVHGEGSRTPPSGLSDEQFPLSGPMVKELITEGLMDPEFGGIEDSTNAELGVRSDFEMKSWNEDGKVEIVPAFTETAFGWSMRLFDQVYSGELVATASNGERITTRNIHSMHDELIEWVYKRETEEAKKQGRQPRFTKHLVTRAFRLHMITTLNHSYLAEDSATIPDNIYYLFNWFDYCIKYADDGTNSFDPLVTLLLFGYRDVNPIEELYGNKVDVLRVQMKAQGFLSDRTGDRVRELGFPSYNQLIDAPLIGLQNVAQGQAYDKNGKAIFDEDPVTKVKIPVPKVKTPVFNPPMRNWTVKQPGSKPGETVPRRYPVSPDGTRGRYITLDDVQSIDGQRLYDSPLFQWENIGTQFVDYYNNLGKNGMAFLDQFLKAASNKFLSEMENPDTVAAFRNQGKYSMSLFPVVGHDVNLGVGNMGERVKNQTIIQLIYAKCLIETDTTRKKFWSLAQVKDYLADMANKRAISFEEAHAIETAVIEGSKFRIRSTELIRRLRDQVKEAARLK